MILSDEEIKSLGEGNQGTWQDDLQFARSIEQAILAKLNSAEPALFIQSNHLDLANHQVFLCRCAPLKLHDDWVPLYEHPPAPSVPTGYQLVPVEPTEAMASAGWDDAIENEADNIDIYDIAGIYRAMLSAARSEE